MKTYLIPSKYIDFDNRNVNAKAAALSAECDFPEIWPEPLPIVTETLDRYLDVTDVHENLPDIALRGANLALAGDAQI